MCTTSLEEAMQGGQGQVQGQGQGRCRAGVPYWEQKFSRSPAQTCMTPACCTADHVPAVRPRTAGLPAGGGVWHFGPQQRQAADAHRVPALPACQPSQAAAQQVRQQPQYLRQQGSSTPRVPPRVHERLQCGMRDASAASRSVSVC